MTGGWQQTFDDSVIVKLSGDGELLDSRHLSGPRQNRAGPHAPPQAGLDTSVQGFYDQVGSFPDVTYGPI